MLRKNKGIWKNSKAKWDKFRAKKKARNAVIQKRVNGFARASSYKRDNTAHMTNAEHVFSEFLKELASSIHISYEPQYIFIPDPKRPDNFFLLDFYIFSPVNLVIEIDGGYHETPEQAEYDSWRQSLIEQYGAHVIRYTNYRVCFDSDSVKNDVKSKIKELSTGQPCSKLPTATQNIKIRFGKMIAGKKKHRSGKRTHSSGDTDTDNDKPVSRVTFPKAFANELALKEWASKHNIFCSSGNKH